MDAAALGPERAALERARLHVRGARRRLRQGKASAGLAALYDALTSAMDWYLAAPERRAGVGARPGELREETGAWAALVRAGVLGATLDFGAFRALVLRGLDEELPPSAGTPFVPAVEAELERLGVLPFDEASLPPEDPATF